MYNFHLTRYYNVNSIMHKLNPLNKIICILLFTFMVLITNNILYLLLLVLFVLILIGMSNVSISMYLKSYKYIVPFVLFIFLIDLLFSNIESGIISILKLILFISYSTLILYTTKPNDITYGLERFLSPLKVLGVDVSSTALTISLAIRFIPIIVDEGERIYKSQISRGLNFNGTIKEKINKLVSLIIPIFNMSLRKSEIVSNVLDTRLYRSNNRRTKYKLYNFSFVDENILLFHIFMLLLLIVLRVIL